VRLLITGANGFIGGRIAEIALDEGDDVRTLTRGEWEGPPYVPLRSRRFGRLPYDLPESAFECVDAVIHCAATAESDPLRCRAVNVIGTLEVAQQARRAGVRAFVFFSSQSARPDAPTPYGRTKHEAEQALVGVGGIDTVILRAGLVCGGGGLFGRIIGVAERLPALPVFAADSVVQPVWVDDLARAALRSARDHEDLAGSILSLGSPQAVALGDVVLAIAARGPRRKRVLRLPYQPVALAVAAAEAAGFRPALSSTNLAGMRTARPMDTRGDMHRLGVPDRSLDEIVQSAMTPRRPGDPDASGDRARRVLLVGAGRIGLVHAITLSRLPGAILSGVVDRSPSALRVLRSVGVEAPGHTSLDEALAGRHDAAVIATPPASHLAFVRACAARNMRVLVEKPASLRPDDLAAYRALVHDRAPVLVGYLLPGSAHVRAALSRLRNGDFGRALAFRAFTLVDFVRAGGPERWETKPAVAGGGVITNSATHVLSLVDAAFGVPDRVFVEVRRSVSLGVEDCAIVRFDYLGLAGYLFASWSFLGFERQENRLVVTTDRGELTITTNVWQFVAGGQVVDAGHQLDHDPGFNLAPDYAGGGIAAELHQLVAPHDDSGAVTLADAIRIETQLHSIYEQARSVGRFTSLVGAKVLPTPLSVAPPQSERLILDLRGRQVDEVRAILADPSPSTGRVEVDLRHLDLVCRHFDEGGVRVTVPDFLRHVRRIGDRRYAEVIRELGIVGGAAAGAEALRGALGERSLGFWTAAAALVAGEVARIPASFRGVVLLHPYLVDLAVALERFDRLEALFHAIGRGHRLGVHSNLARETANALALLHQVPEVLSVLVSPNTSALPAIGSWLTRDERLRGIHLTAEVGPSPLGLHLLAARDPDRWLPGANSLLVSGLANSAVYAAAERGFDAEWGRQFEGTAPVGGAL
jgi:predicted dehydrogenase/nucleoside-diphosphate-sugar epimerase